MKIEHIPTASLVDELERRSCAVEIITENAYQATEVLTRAIRDLKLYYTCANNHIHILIVKPEAYLQETPPNEN